MVAGGALLARALQGFLVDPIGDGSDLAKYAHNTVAVLLVIVLVAIGWRRNRDQPALATLAPSSRTTSTRRSRSAAVVRQLLIAGRKAARPP